MPVQRAAYLPCWVDNVECVPSTTSGLGVWTFPLTTHFSAADEAWSTPGASQLNQL
jgi:hypothetical protein